MTNIEPYYNWLDYYDPTTDDLSPFYGREYSEFNFSNKIYNYYIHPQWDFFGSSTLYMKILYADYGENFAVIELIGEWNDCLHNDIMYLKRNIIDHMVKNEIFKFIFIAENVLNFHSSDDCYYEECYEDLRDEDGWITIISLREHILDEMYSENLDHYIHFDGDLNTINWRTFTPPALLKMIEHLLKTETRKLTY